MIKEFAIEPEALVSLLDPRVVINFIGPDHGRFITNDKSESWQAGIKEYLKEYIRLGKIGYRQVQVLDYWMTQQTQTAEQNIYITNLEHDNIYDEDISLSSKVPIDSYRVTHDGRNGSFESEEISENLEWWRINRSANIKKTRKEYLKVLKKTVGLASRIVIIDPYITSSNRHISLLRGISSAIDPKRMKLLSIILGGSKNDWERNCEVISREFQGINIEFIRGETAIIEGKRVKFHCRYILTDVASYTSTYGLEDEESEGTYGNRTTLALIEQSQAQIRISSIDADKNTPRIDEVNGLRFTDRRQIIDTGGN